MSFADIPIRFLVLKKETNLENHLRWLEYLAGEEFAADWKQSIQTGGHMQELIKSARQIVEEHIYAFNTTEEGTGRIEKSFTGKYLESQYGSFAVYSDKNVAPSKKPAGQWSYAAFFEDPKFHTFLPPPDDQFDTRRYRPFFWAMTTDHQRIGLRIAYEALIRTIKKRMPRL